MVVWRLLLARQFHNNAQRPETELCRKRIRIIRRFHSNKIRAIGVGLGDSWTITFLFLTFLINFISEQCCWKCSSFFLANGQRRTFWWISYLNHQIIDLNGHNAALSTLQKSFILFSVFLYSSFLNFFSVLPFLSKIKFADVVGLSTINKIGNFSLYLMKKNWIWAQIKAQLKMFRVTEFSTHFLTIEKLLFFVFFRFLSFSFYSVIFISV